VGRLCIFDKTLDTCLLQTNRAFQDFESMNDLKQLMAAPECKRNLHSCRQCSGNARVTIIMRIFHSDSYVDNDILDQSSEHAVCGKNLAGAIFRLT
jgi:hypothetical protein